LRIAQMVQTLDTGGAERLAAGIAAALARRGHDSHLIVMSGPGTNPALESAGGNYHSLGLPRDDRPLGPASLGRLWGLLRRLNGVMARRDIQILQTHLPLANFLGLGISLQRKVAFFPTLHNNQEFAYGDQGAFLRSRFRRGAYREMVQRANRMVAVSDAVREAMCHELDLSAEASRRLVVVTNGVPVPEVPGPEARASARAAFNLSPETRVLAAVGRLSPQKNFQELIAGLAGLGPEQKDWLCLIAGEGPEREALENHLGQAGLKGKVRLLGQVDRVDALLSAADIFCLTSSWEGLPLALLEGMAAGLPVAAAAIDGVVEVVPNGKAGLLHTPGDEVELTANLSRLLADEGLRRTLGGAAREHVVAAYDFEKTVDALETLYGARQDQQELSG